jgi:hypothetical protein
MAATIKQAVSKSNKTRCAICENRIPTTQVHLRVGGLNYCIQSDCHHDKYMGQSHPNAVLGEIDDRFIERMDPAIVARSGGNWRNSSESVGERKMEHHAAHRAAGISTQVAFENWDYDN